MKLPVLVDAGSEMRESLASRRPAVEAVDYEELATKGLTMVDPKEQKLAKATLDTRNVEFSVWYLLQKNFFRYLIISAVFAPGLALLYYEESFLMFHWVFGVWLGVLIRDIAWFRAIVGAHPFSMKVTDWEKVRRIAEGESVD